MGSESDAQAAKEAEKARLEAERLAKQEMDRKIAELRREWGNNG